MLRGNFGSAFIHGGKGFLPWVEVFRGKAPDAVQTEADLVEHPEVVVTVAEPTQRPTWPKSMPDQVTAVRNLLVIGPQSTDALSAQFKRKPTKSVTQVLAALEVLGQAHQEDGRWQLV